jgi:hypothetical protein
VSAVDHRGAQAPQAVVGGRIRERAGDDAADLMSEAHLPSEALGAVHLGEPLAAVVGDQAAQHTPSARPSISVRTPSGTVMA